MRRTTIKICGLTREEDVALACELGAAFLGFNFVASSPRRIRVEKAAALCAVATPGVRRVGVFSEEDRAVVARAVETVPLDVVQLHRPVTPEDVGGFGVPVFAAVRIEDGLSGAPPESVLSRCAALLWDSSAGTGAAPDWNLVPRPELLGVPVFLAGGLDADNVAGVVRSLRPSGVDVASGVESAPGVKDRRKLERFFEAVREADRG